jgi:hypothetical protein
MNEEGYWSKPGAGYNPKYFSSVWSIIMLAQMGANVTMDGRLKPACDYLVSQNLVPGGQFGYNGTPSGTIDCLQGNLCWALTTLGYPYEALAKAYDWMARSVTGEGIAPASESKAEVRYYAYKCGPNFACGPNNKLPCAWGAAKVMLAFSILPKEKISPLIKSAIQQGLDFFLSVDPADAAYPTRDGKAPSRDWWKLGFPVFYVTDMLQVVEALVGLGLQHDPWLERALTIILKKQDDRGCWALEYDYKDKTWVNFGVKKQPNPWVTLRVLRVLKAVNH